MDTKWRKSKIILSFAAFFLGVTLLVTNFLSMVVLLADSDLRTGKDYQDTRQFSGFISGRLEELIGAAVGGENWYRYSYSGAPATEEGVSYGDSYKSTFFYGGSSYGFAEEVTVVGETVEEAAGSAVEESSGEASDWEYAEKEEDTLDSYMKELSEDKNLLYAVFYQGELLWTNIDGVPGDAAGLGSSPQNWVSQEEYNFYLCYNQEGDGKVSIVKDNHSVDVYGDGVYKDDSRWYVPGYTNFQAGEKALEVEIFIAVAREPKIYVTGDYEEGTVQRGGRLCWMQEALQYQRRKLALCTACVGAGLLLLLGAWFFKKERKEAEKIIGAWLERLPFVLKRLLFSGLPLCLLLAAAWGVLGEMRWILEELLYGNGGLLYSDMQYAAGVIEENGALAMVCAWLLYLGVLERRRNPERQESLLGKFKEFMETKELGLPVSKRLVRRQWLILLPSLALLLLVTVFTLMLWDISWWRQSCVYLIIWLCAMGFTAVCHIVYLKKNRRLARDIGALSEKIKAVRDGKLDDMLKLPEEADLLEAAESLNEIQQGMEKAVQERIKSERMKVELVANVSHDVKTPLTSIVSYVELLKQEENLPDYIKDYIRILGEKSERLGNMVQDVFEVSKAASGNLPVKPERLDFGKLLRQTLADMNAPIEESGLGFRVSIPEEPVEILADGQRMYRVFQNLLQNVLQYSLKGSRVYLTLQTAEGYARAVLKNTSGTELGSGTDFTERFVRGDRSRTDGGSGLGLSIAKSFTEACGGQFAVETDADLFTVTVTFPSVSA